MPQGDVLSEQYMQWIYMPAVEATDNLCVGLRTYALKMRYP